MPWTTDDLPDLSGRTFVVTGANSGLGLDTSRELARAGGHVVMACRSRDRASEAMEQIGEQVDRPSLELIRLDLADLSSIHAFADRFLTRHDRLDVLIDNAGIMAIPRRETADGFEMQMGVNHFGHFALTGLLLERLIDSTPSRVVTVSSGAHRMADIDFDDLDHQERYQKWEAYGQSKLANLLFAFELDRRLRDAGVDVVSAACHPGYAATNLQHVGPRMSGNPLAKWGMKFANAVLAQDSERGALPSLYAATADDVEGGDYIGPDGLFEMRGHPTKVEARRAAYDEERAARLWQISVERTGVDYAVLDR